MTLRFACALLLATAVWFAAAPSFAQTPVHPPELVGFVDAEYPPAALRERLGAEVGLELSIDREGRVQAAEVVAGAGDGFDEAATAAALRFRFTPARRGDVAVAARILYRYVFTPPPEAAEPVTSVSSAPVPQETPPPSPPLLPASAVGAPHTAGSAPQEVTVQGQSKAERLKQSAEAVTVIETERAQRQTADLGEVLARTQGVGVRRSGGLGSDTRFSLNGLTDDQIRFFLDGVPLELMGYPFGISNVPVNLVERIEIYGGVVPIRFGADALGGAVNLVTYDDPRKRYVGGSYEVGSFDTHRLTLSARGVDAPTGLLLAANGFVDSALNDYVVDVEVPDEKGKLEPASVRRFHDAYRALGWNAEVGVVEKQWAKRLTLRAFATDYQKDYQHNVVMSVPYGEVTYGETSLGSALHYQQHFGRGVTLDAVAGYTHTEANFVDAANCVYDWFGRCGRAREEPGESDIEPHDQLFWDNTAFARLNAGYRFHPQHGLRASVSPTYFTRTGDERLQSDPTARDALAAQRDLTTIVSGLEYEADLFEDRLEAIPFFKHYLQSLKSEEPRPGNGLRRRDRATPRFGGGAGVRYRVVAWLYAKASYEFATRLPDPDEIFGDNAFVVANLELEPEKSHNANLGIAVETRETRAGAFRGSANGFLRSADRLIVLLGNDRVQSYHNVYAARSLGVEAAAGWTSLGRYLSLDANGTYLDFRNASSEGAFGSFEGDRIPNRPYLFANFAARLEFSGVAAARDEVSVTFDSRYVHEFFRGWESVGIKSLKQVIPSQLVHTAGVGYLVRGDHAELSMALEVQNLTDEAVYDFVGVERPGRAFYVKTTAEF